MQALRTEQVKAPKRRASQTSLALMSIIAQ
jgi:hypothetical protein